MFLNAKHLIKKILYCRYSFNKMIRFYLKNHYHVRCVKCGEVSGVDVDEISDLIERILACHPKDF